MKKTSWNVILKVIIAIPEDRLLFPHHPNYLLSHHLSHLLMEH